MATASDVSANGASASNSRKRALPLPPVAPPPLPEAVAWLEHATLALAATHSRTTQRRAAVEFELTVAFARADDADSATSWAVRRSLAQYAAFQKLLLKKLRLGHACKAECAWLHAVVKRHFPRPPRFYSARSGAKVEARRSALLRVLTTLQASLLNRGNHGCAVFLADVATAFCAFLVGSSDCADALADSTRSAQSSSERSTRGSFSSAESDASDSAGDGDFRRLAAFDATCGQCGASLDVDETEAQTCTTTAFGCGHQFHDACLAARLGRRAARRDLGDVACPTCGYLE